MKEDSGYLNGGESSFDGWNIALAVGDILDDRLVYTKYGIGDSEMERLGRVFPDPVHPNCDEIIPDSILPWNK